MTYPIHWISLDIGYESLTDDTTSGPPLLQIVLEYLFRRSTILRWANGGHTPIANRPLPANHRWVTNVIADEINNELGANGNRAPNVVVRYEDVCVAVARPYSATLPNPQVLLAGETSCGENAWEAQAAEDKDVHTRCRLVGPTWINSRTYRLSQPDGKGGYKPWMPVAYNAAPYLLATLTWPCHEMERFAPELYPQAPLLEPVPLTEAAARSRGAGKPAGASGSKAGKRARPKKP